MIEEYEQHPYLNYLAGVRQLGQSLERAISSVIPSKGVTLHADLTITDSKIRIVFKPVYHGKGYKDVSGG